MQDNPKSKKIQNPVYLELNLGPNFITQFKTEKYIFFQLLVGEKLQKKEKTSVVFPSSCRSPTQDREP